MLLRALLVIPDPALRRRLRGCLEELGVLVSERSSTNRLEELRADTVDLLLTTPAELAEPLEATVRGLRELPERPELVFFGGDGEPALRARLLAAGSPAVIPDNLPPGQLLETLEALVERRRRTLADQVQNGQELGHSRLRDFTSRSPVMAELIAVAKKVSVADTSLLLLGETGVGKEWLGRAIHAEGPRARGPFIAVNPSALPEPLLESELFGHEKGAFTGAVRARRGAFELAHGGTLFLDEIGDMSVHLQIKLLRVLEERQIRRLGSERSVAVDVRIMAATHQNLDAAIAERAFRQDLYFRLSVMRLTVPPLRARRPDIAPLVASYVERYRRQLGRPEVTGVSAAALAALESYDWPGNVRELINVIERSVLLCEGGRISLETLPEEICAGVSPAAGADATPDPAKWMDSPLPEARRELVAAFEATYLSRLLAETRGNVGATAIRAGVDPRTLYNRMRKLGLRKEDFKTPRDGSR